MHTAQVFTVHTRKPRQHNQVLVTFRAFSNTPIVDHESYSLVQAAMDEIASQTPTLYSQIPSHYQGKVARLNRYSVIVSILW